MSNAVLIEGLETFKVKYKPKQEYSILLFITTENTYFAAVFKKQEITSKKEGLYIADLSIFNVRAATIHVLVNSLSKYIVSI